MGFNTVLTRWAGRRVLPMAAAAGLSVAVVVAGVGGAVAGGRIDLLEGAAWLPSTIGQVALVSGASAQPMAALAVGAPKDDLSVVQSGSDAYVINRTAGTVLRVDGGTFAQTAPVRFAPTGGARLQVLLGGGSVFILDGAKGLVYQVDPVTLTVMGTARPLQASVTPDSATVDASGRLWVIDDRSGDLKWFDKSEGVRRGTSVGGTLVLAAGKPVLVGSGGADWLAPDGSSSAHVNFDLRAGERPEVSGTSDGRLLLVIAARGIVELCDQRGCDSEAYSLTAAGRRLGPAVLDQGLIFVPDLTKGQVHVVSTTSGTEVATPIILKPTADFDLFQRDTLLFYNDRSTDRAGVLRLDGTYRSVQKYQPGDPGKGLDAAADKHKAPPVTPPALTSASRTTSPSAGDSGASSTASPPPSGATLIADPNNPAATPVNTGTTSVFGGPGPGPGTSSSTSTSTTSTSTTSTSTTSTSTTTTPRSTTTPPTTTTPSGTAPPQIDAINISSRLGAPYYLGDVLTFTASISGGPPTTWAWTLSYVNDATGAKATSTDSSFSFPVDSGGSSYQDWVVSLRLTNLGGKASKDSNFTVRIIDGRPFQLNGITISPTAAAPGQSVALAADIQGPLAGCKWAIGASAPTTDCHVPLTAPTAPGTYDVTAVATSRAGNTATRTTALVVPSPPVVSNLTCSGGAANAGSPVTCTASAPGADTWNWSVDSGGQTGTDVGTFTFTPARAQTYTVTLDVTGTGGPGHGSTAITAVDTTGPQHTWNSPESVTIWDDQSGIRSGARLSVAFDISCSEEVTVVTPLHRTASDQLGADSVSPVGLTIIAPPPAGDPCVRVDPETKHRLVGTWDATPTSSVVTVTDGAGIYGTWTYPN